MEERMVKVFANQNSKIALKVYHGHYATPHSHISHYFDMTTLKTRTSEAHAVAHELAKKYANNTIVDTIITLDGTEVIGAYLAEELTEAGIMCMNAHKAIYVISPEFNNQGNVIFRDNVKPMLKDKHILVLVGTATTGGSLLTCMDALSYYGGIPAGVCSVFSAISKIMGIEVNAVFTQKDLPEYHSYTSRDCPCCKKGEPIDAIVNGFGYSRLGRRES